MRRSGKCATGELHGRLANAQSRYAALAPWLLYREEDAVLILPPNRVFKLGGSGSVLLSWLAKGGRLSEIPDLDEAKVSDIEAFFLSIEAASAGRPVDLDRVPYDFSFTRLPVIGELALTYACNAACAFCYAGCGDDGADGAAADGASADAAVTDPESVAVDAGCRRGPIDPRRREMGTAEAKRVIRVFKEEAKIPFFSFTGGEPLLREDLEELAAFANSLGLRCNLITNGTLADPTRARRLKAAGIDTAQVSLESPLPAVHDALCGLEGGWKRTVAGISSLREAGIAVQTNTTLTARNRESLNELPAFLKGLGVARFSMNLYIPSGRGLGARNLLVPYIEAGTVVERVRKEAFIHGLAFFWYSPTPYCLFNPVAKGLGNKSCAALDGLVHVNPYGEILPCSSWPEAMGSLLDGKFEEIWFQERSAWFKEKRFAPEACTGCASFVACQGACPLYWRAVGCAELADPKASALEVGNGL